MFRFENSTNLWLIILLPIIYLGLRSFMRKKNETLKKWGNDEIVKALTKGQEHNHDNARYPSWLAALFLCTIALANPQWGFNNEQLKTNASDVYIALDISKSMEVQDVAPSRLIRSKKYATDLIQSLKGNNIGLILFAGSAYMQMPLTSDYAAAIMMVNAANTDLAGTQGTDITAITELIKRANEKQATNGGYLVIITDGEDHEGEAIASIKSLRQDGFITYSIGAGTKEGGYISEGSGYKLDEDGKPIVSKLNIDLINDIAKSGDGIAFSLEDQSSISTISDDISNGDKSEKTSKTFNQYNSYFQLFLALALCLFFVEYILSKWYHLKKSN